MKVRDVIKLIEADGWYFDRMKGSHRQFKHTTKKGSLQLQEIKETMSSKGHSVVY